MNTYDWALEKIKGPLLPRKSFCIGKQDITYLEGGTPGLPFPSSGGQLSFPGAQSSFFHILVPVGQAAPWAFFSGLVQHLYENLLQYDVHDDHVDQVVKPPLTEREKGLRRFCLYHKRKLVEYLVLYFVSFFVSCAVLCYTLYGTRHLIFPHFIFHHLTLLHITFYHLILLHMTFYHLTLHMTLHIWSSIVWPSP